MGCDSYYFKEYIEKLFIDGMNWENYGEWEIDHIIPLSKFNLDNNDELKKCCNYKNLQPLFISDNRKKGSKCDEVTEP